MIPTLTGAHLAANLEALGERNAEVAETVRRSAGRSDMTFTASRAGDLTATIDGRSLASRHDPVDEGRRLAGTVDVIDHAVIVIAGFGLGYHVQALVERVKASSIIVVYEPDVDLLQSVLDRIDHSEWMRDARLVFVTDATDRGGLGRKLDGAEAIVAMGMAFQAHPASRARLRDTAADFQQMLTDFVGAARTTFLTTIIRAVDTVRNMLYNIDHYVGGPGIAELQGAAAGRAAIVVSAGPSLSRNLHLLEDPSVRERCVIIATQTTLKPLLRRGIRPHFITALDFHEISRRFYDGLTESDVAGVTLVADPKAHPSILDAFPGSVRCCRGGLLDRILGPLERDMGHLPAGATVAHLCLYLARFLGCDKIALIGQDLCFPDGLYYAPGLAIHDVWAPELNPFNTIASMEWQRIARHRANLHRVTDVHGRSVYSDTQMLTYLQQFERDFAAYVEDGIEVIDATEGGLPKQHTRRQSLEAFLAHVTREPLPELAPASRALDTKRMRNAARRVADVRRDVVALERLSRETTNTIRSMLTDALDEQDMACHFEQLDRGRREVEKRMESFEILNFVNQLGVFRRLRADRRLELMSDLGPRERQRAQLERDLQNVEWIEEAAAEMQVQLADATRILDGAAVPLRRPTAHAQDPDPARRPAQAESRIAAIVPVDLERNGLGLRRSLAAPFGGRPVLQATLERLAAVPGLESIILLAADGAPVEQLVDTSALRTPVIIERGGVSVWGPEQRAIAVARLWADTCWRGGIGGASVFDECLSPVAMQAVMERHDLTAALVVAPDWPLIDPSRETGCAALIERHREHPDRHRLVFNQAAPGLGGCLIARPLMDELAARTRLSTIGALLVYQPHAPQGDPIATEANVQAEPPLRDALVRATFDSARQCEQVGRALANQPASQVTPETITRALAAAVPTSPRHLVIELTTDHGRRGVLGRERGDADRGPLSTEQLARILAPIGTPDDIVVTFGGHGDPLCHPEFDACIAAARDAGAAAVHVRTDLIVAPSIIDRLVASGVDVVSIDVHADAADTYHHLMGIDAFQELLVNTQRLLDARRHLAGPPAAAGFALPWIVPRLARRPETVEQVDGFFDRWQLLLGTAVIDPCPHDVGINGIARTVTPTSARQHESMRTMTILADGSVPVRDDDPDAGFATSLYQADLPDAWRDLVALRRAHEERPDDGR